MLTEAKVKKWGGSYGLLISKKDANRFHLKENQQVSVEIIPKSNALKELFGSGKGKINFYTAFSFNIYED